MEEINSEQGFTLVELIIVVLMIGILFPAIYMLFNNVTAVFQSSSEEIDFNAAGNQIMTSLENNILNAGFLFEINNGDEIKFLSYTDNGIEALRYSFNDSDGNIEFWRESVAIDDIIDDDEQRIREDNLINYFAEEIDWDNNPDRNLGYGIVDDVNFSRLVDTRGEPTDTIEIIIDLEKEIRGNTEVYNIATAISPSLAIIEFND